MITPTGSLTTLYNFCPLAGCLDGSAPIAKLMEAANHELYGTTTTGGVNNAGVILTITPTGTFSTIYSFCSQANCADGGSPYAPLIQTRNGDFYGTTTSTAYRFTPSGTLVILYTFCPANTCDGFLPLSFLPLA